MNVFKLSWKNLIYKPWNLTLTLILFALGVGLASVLFQLDRQLKQQLDNNLAGIDLVIGAKGSPLQLILSSMYHIDAPTGNITLEQARPFLRDEHPLIEIAVPLSLGDSYKGFRIVGTTPAFLDLYQLRLDNGRLWDEGFEAVIGSEVAKQLDLKIGSEFSGSHGLMEETDFGHNDHHFHVVGILDQSNSVADNLLLTANQSYWALHAAHEEGEETTGHSHPEILPLLEEDASKEITSLLLTFSGRNIQSLNMQRSINQNTSLQAASPVIEVNRLFVLMSSGQKALALLAIVILIVSGLSVFISLYTSLKERKYELALLRVMGAGPSKLFGLLIVEGVMLALIGCLLGLILSHVSMNWMGGLLEENYRMTMPVWQLIDKEWILLLSSLLIGIVASLIPAIKARKTEIAELITNY